MIVVARFQIRPWVRGWLAAGSFAASAIIRSSLSIISYIFKRTMSILLKKILEMSTFLAILV